MAELLPWPEETSEAGVIGGKGREKGEGRGGEGEGKRGEGKRGRGGRERGGGGVTSFTL